MKRTATLLAGLLLVTGTVFAAESKLDFFKNKDVFEI